MSSETPEMVFRDLLGEWESFSWQIHEEWGLDDGAYITEGLEAWERRWAEAEARAVERARIIDERLRP